MVRILFIFLLLFSGSLSNAQDKYWIYFSDKGNDISQKSHVSAQTIERRKNANLPMKQASDLPVSRAYIDSLASYQISPVNQSRWLNAISAELTADQAREIAGISFVKAIDPVNTDIMVNQLNFTEKSLNFSLALMQINAEAIVEEELTGKGVNIGIIDGGFDGADEDSSLLSIFRENRFLGAADYVNPNNENIFKTSDSNIDWHGTMVWRHIAGHIDDHRQGLAKGSNYLIARTDHGSREFRGEEDYWIAAAEWMDSLGVSIINTSLGYSLNFDDPEENYSPEQMDGSTSAISRAVQIAADEKGILVVVSAGNDGDNPEWQVVSTPADAAGAFTVGATNFRDKSKASYSAIGPEFLDYLKPNVSCFSLFGTSFSAPVITGLAACLMEYNPELTPLEVGKVIEKAGHLYPFGNNYVGYGVPDVERALSLADNPEMEIEGKEVVRKKKYRIKTMSEQWAVLYHKKDKKNVIKEEAIEPENNRFVIKKPKNAKRTTFSGPEETIEIIWK